MSGCGGSLTGCTTYPFGFVVSRVLAHREQDACELACEGDSRDTSSATRCDAQSPLREGLGARVCSA
jgi:hypothetical protein